MSAQIDGEAPAFPVPLLPGETWIGPGSPLGMTLRDYFAGQALAVLLTLPEDPEFTTIHFAKASYEMADAMIEARKGGER